MVVEAVVLSFNVAGCGKDRGRDIAGSLVLGNSAGCGMWVEARGSRLEAGGFDSLCASTVHRSKMKTEECTCHRGTCSMCTSHFGGIIGASDTR